jgi:hypothetical protein
MDYSNMERFHGRSTMFFGSYWSLNSGLHTCQAGPLLLEPHLQPRSTFFFFTIFCGVGSQTQESHTW